LSHKIKLRELEKYFDCVVLVEGARDVEALRVLGFEKIYAIHWNKKSVRERIEEIVKEIGRDKTFCILTDTDSAGRKLYSQIVKILQELGVRVDNGLRDLLFESGVSHVEGFATFFDVKN
jgi:5S rRNA maturation endonuclease (ribonuclease M5)